MNRRPLGYEPNELPDCSTPRLKLAVYTDFWRLRNFATNSSGRRGRPCSPAARSQRNLIRIGGLTAYVCVASPTRPSCRAGTAGSFRSPTRWRIRCWSASMRRRRALHRPRDALRRAAAEAASRVVRAAGVAAAAGRSAGVGGRAPPLPVSVRRPRRSLGPGLAARLARRPPDPATFTMAITDYGMELLSATAIDWHARLRGLLAPVDRTTLRDEVLAGASGRSRASPG